MKPTILWGSFFFRTCYNLALPHVKDVIDSMINEPDKWRLDSYTYDGPGNVSLWVSSIFFDLRFYRSKAKIGFWGRFAVRAAIKYAEAKKISSKIKS